MATNLALFQVNFPTFSANRALDVGTPMPFRSLCLATLRYTTVMEELIDDFDPARTQTEPDFN